MATAALSRVLVHNPGDLDPLARASQVFAGVLFCSALLSFLILLTVQAISLHREGDRIRDRIVAPMSGPTYAAVPGSVLVLLLAVLGFEPQILANPTVFVVVLVLTTVSLLVGFWLTLTFFVAAFEQNDFDSQTISGTWFIPETVILLSVLVFSGLAREAEGSLASALAAGTLAVMGAGFLLFILTATLFFGRLVMLRQYASTGVAAVWIMMSPLSVSAMALGSTVDVVPILVPTSATDVAAFTSLGSGLLWGFGLWWLAAALLLTWHEGRKAWVYSPGSWGFVFPPAALSLASFGLARTWNAAVFVEWVGVTLAVLTMLIWLFVAVNAIRWVSRHGWRKGRP